MGKAAKVAVESDKSGSGAAKAQHAAGAKAKAKSSKATVKAAEGDMSRGCLAGIRPAPRWIYFVLFSTVCGWMAFFHDQCDVAKGKRRDCGYGGISVTACRTKACFMKAAKRYDDHKVQVTVEKGSTLGLTVAREGASVVVKALSDGAVLEHNSKADGKEKDTILAGDIVKRVSIDGKRSDSAADIQKALATAGSGKPFEIEVQRPRLPSFLRWIEGGTEKQGIVEKVLTAPGTAHFFKLWSQLGGVGLAAWFLSGYPLASLPLYALFSGGLAVELTRCCHDDTVSGNIPHCYRSKGADMTAILGKLVESGREMVGKVQNDPRGYAMAMFKPQKLPL